MKSGLLTVSKYIVFHVGVPGETNTWKFAANQASTIYISHR